MAKNLIIIDDDKFLLDMYALKFKKSGYEVECIASPEEAVKKLREGLNPDVIILDIIMPGMTGLEILETIRSEKLATSSLVIMLTNNGDPADIETAKKFGVDGYIIKASSIPSEVVAQVDKIYGKGKS